MTNYGLKSCSFSDKETSHIFLYHLDNTRYTNPIEKCESELLLSSTVDLLYLVPAIAGTIYQLRPENKPSTINQHGCQQENQIRAMMDYYHDDKSSVIKDYC